MQRETLHEYFHTELFLELAVMMLLFGHNNLARRIKLQRVVFQKQNDQI